MQQAKKANNYLDEKRTAADFGDSHEGLAFVSQMMPIIEEPFFLDRIDNTNVAAEISEQERSYVGAHVLLSRRNDLLEKMVGGQRLGDIYGEMKEKISPKSVREWLHGPRIADETRQDYRDLDQLVGGNSSFLEAMPYRSVQNLVAYTWVVACLLLLR